MPASSYTELFNFEGNVESAFREWLADQVIEVRETLGLESLPDDYIGTTFKLGAVTGHYNPSPGGAANPTYDQYEFDLDFIIQTRRHNEEGSQTDGVKARHRELVALLRTWVSLLKAKGSSLETYLNHYEIQFLRPSGTANDVDDVFDITTLSYEGQISIVTTAWPTV
tara:strand:+ start:264 stop:767 length:504 start_codon:yes stop_codon:yes gene_type:complete